MRALLALAFLLAAQVGAPEPRPQRPAPDAPPPQLMVNIKALLDAAREYRLDANLVFSVAWAESELFEGAISTRWALWTEADKDRWDYDPGQLWHRQQIARGLMQISIRYQDELVRRYLGWHPSQFDWRNPIHSAKLGCAYLAALIKRFGTWGGVAAYNAGPGRFLELAHGRPLPAETVEYVGRIFS